MANKYTYVNDALNIVDEWFKKEHILHDRYEVSIDMFVYMQIGYRCLIHSTKHDGLYFSISKNLHTGDYSCDVLMRSAHLIKLGKVDNEKR